MGAKKESIEEKIHCAVIDLHLIGQARPSRHLVATMAGYASATSSPFPAKIKKLEDNNILKLGRGFVELVASPQEPQHAAVLVYNMMRKKNAISRGKIVTLTRAVMTTLSNNVMQRAQIASSLGYKSATSQPISVVLTSLKKLNVLYSLSRGTLGTSQQFQALSSDSKCKHSLHPMDDVSLKRPRAAREEPAVISRKEPAIEEDHDAVSAVAV